jgi:hypothetical protein
LYLGQTHSFLAIRPTPDVEQPSAEPSKLPYFSAHKIVMEDVDFGFNHPDDSIRFQTVIGRLELEPNRVDLNTQEVDIHQLVLLRSNFKMHMLSPEKNDVASTKEASSNNWQVKAKHILFDENGFEYHDDHFKRISKGIDYNHLVAQNIGIDANDLFYSTEMLKGEIKQLTVEEQSGLSILKLRTSFLYDDQHAELANLYLQTSHSKIAKYISIHYPSIESLSKHPEKLEVNLHLKQTEIAMSDVLIFVPELESNASLKQLVNENFRVNGNIVGVLDNLHLSGIVFQTGSQTAIALNGNIKGLPDPNQLFLDLTVPTLTTSREDLQKILPEAALPESIQLPLKMMANGTLHGSLKDFRTDWSLHTNDGNLAVKVSLNQRGVQPLYTAEVESKQLNLGAILRQPLLGKLSGKIVVNGCSFDPQKMETAVSSEWTEIGLNDYTYTHFSFNANASDGLIHSSALVKDANLHIVMETNLSVQAENSYAVVDLNVIGANLKELNITPGAYRVSGAVKSTLHNLMKADMSGNFGIGGMQVAKEQQRYRIDSLLVIGVNEKRKNLDKVDAVCKVVYQGKTKLQDMAAVVEHTIHKYWGEEVALADTIDANFNCAIQLNPHPVLSELLFPGLGRFNGIALTYSTTSDVSKLMVDAPLVEYNQMALNNFHINLDGGKDSLVYKVFLQSISGEQYFIPQTTLNGSVAHNRFAYDLQMVKPDSGYRIKVNGMVSQHGDTMTMRLLQKSIVLNNLRWTVDQGNQILITDKGINIQHLKLKSGTQLLAVQSTTQLPNAPFSIRFDQFALQTFSQLVERDSAIVRGVLNGKVQLNPSDKFAFISDLNIDGIVFNGVKVGDLMVKADNQTPGRYTANIKLSGNDNRAGASGYYENGNVQFQVEVQKLNLHSVEAFIPKVIQRSNGFATASIHLTGKADHPDFDGNIGLKNASFNVALLNSRLSFADEKILLNKEGIRFNRFTVRDSMQQPLIIDGNVYTQNFVNMRFDLDIRTQHFRVLNTSEKDNKVYYGKILLNSKIKVTGTEKLPKVDAEVKLIEGSDLTFVVQQGELSTDRGEGIVEFVDTATNDLLKDTVSRMTSSFVGLDINATIEVNNATRFKIVTDKTSGDNLVVQGDAALNFSIDESGKISLVGAYILTDGSYKASLQKIVKREFYIKRGSSITWSGDPLDAVIDITATYKAKSNSVDLLAAELEGYSESQRQQYRKLMDYDVNLLMQGFLLKPDLHFNIDMSEKQKETNAMVYSKISQINNDPNELNKQVFSLLILGHFVPMGTGSGVTTSSAVSSIARNSVNQLFSDQLNALSGKYIKGAELNFNLQSNDDYNADGSANQSTELQIGLKKELFNNRVVVQVGGNIGVGGNTQNGNQNITGDMVMEYKITEDGAYRFKAFRENGYEGIIDGLLYKTGIGFLYSKDYDSIQQLFVVPPKEEELKVKEEEVE